MFNELNDGNIAFFAAKYYDNTNCENLDEFYEDLNRIRYIIRLFGKYQRQNELKERLLLNHFVILYNVFEPKALTRILKHRLSDYLGYLKPFLFYLGFWDEEHDNIVMDQHIIDVLRKI